MAKKHFIINLALILSLFLPAYIDPARVESTDFQRIAPCLETDGQIIIRSMDSLILPDPMQVRIYLPPCYDQETDRRYPVLYLFHGQGYNDDEWDRLGADDTLDSLIYEGRLQPLILVMPRDVLQVDPPADPFGDAVAAELVPWMDANFRTIADREHRAVGGLSRGAAWAVHLALNHWDLFSVLGAHSLPAFWSDVPTYKGILNSLPDEAALQIFLDVPEYDRYRESAIWFHNKLLDAGIEHEWHVYPGIHEEAYWQSHTLEYLQWYGHALYGSGIHHSDD